MAGFLQTVAAIGKQTAKITPDNQDKKMTIKIGSVLAGRYKVLEVLGAGGFGDTYIAEDTHRPGNPQCVVKRLRSASNGRFSKTARRMFDREAEVLEKLGSRHSQIPTLLARFQERGEFYLVQEFIEGHNLSKEMSSGQRWSEPQVIDMLVGVSEVLDFIHNRDAIHRDIKPDNIIRRDADNKLVLIDFGAIKEVRNQELSQTGQFGNTMAIGTPGYTPVEQWEGNPRPNSDIYSLGMVGIQAVTGIDPNQLRKHKIIWQKQAQISPSLAAVLTKMTRSSFEQRYKTAREVLNALKSLQGQAPPPPTTIETKLSPPPSSNSPSPTGSKLPMFLASVAVLIVAGALWAFNKEQDPLETTPTPTPTSPAGMPTTSPANTPDTPEPSPIATIAPEPPKPLVRVVNVESDKTLYIYSEPDKNSQKLGCIPYDGIDVEVTGESGDRGSWVQIWYKGITGWVDKNHLSPQTGSRGGTRSLASSGIVSNPYRIVDVFWYDVLFIRNDAGKKNKVVGCIPYDGRDVEIVGEGVNVTTRIRTSMWVPIKYKRFSGWVNRRYLTPQQ